MKPVPNVFPAVLPPLTLHFRRGWAGYWEVRTEGTGGVWVRSDIDQARIVSAEKVAEILLEDWGRDFKVVWVEDAQFDA